MKHLCFTLLIILSVSSCQKKAEMSSVKAESWENRQMDRLDLDSLTRGSSYLSVYSQIYQIHKRKTFDLTVTVSMRNVSPRDTIYLLKADYHNTAGDLIRNYFNKPIYLKPLETIEIVIDEKDRDGGSGANFIFDWAIRKNTHAPLFEAVMISTTGQQGLSFATQGVNISNGK